MKRRGFLAGILAAGAVPALASPAKFHEVKDIVWKTYPDQATAQAALLKAPMQQMLKMTAQAVINRHSLNDKRKYKIYLQTYAVVEHLRHGWVLQLETFARAPV